MSEGKGWRGIGPNAGRFVPASDGFHHAAHECGVTMFDQTAPLAEEFKELLVGWYFSGNWVKTGKSGEAQYTI